MRSKISDLKAMPERVEPRPPGNITVTRAIRELARGTFTSGELREKISAKYPNLKLGDLTIWLWQFKARGEVTKVGRGPQAQWTVVKLMTEADAAQKVRQRMKGDMMGPKRGPPKGGTPNPIAREYEVFRSGINTPLDPEAADG